MIILIANQKGGAGKSTLCMLLANYLTKEKERAVAILDMDLQRSVTNKFKDAQALNHEPPYQVTGLDIAKYHLVSSALQKEPASLFIIDLPGKIDDEGLQPVLESADLVIIPFAYERMSYEATLIFGEVFRLFNTKAPIVYIPNRVKTTPKKEAMEPVHAELGKKGQITDIIYDRNEFQRVETFFTPKLAAEIVNPIFNQLYEAHFIE
ncbi:ParA family protein [Mucilaginibacter lappiensis]|uniref:Chromosome partitioning protein n=1 Tax=Mucilaginibacter lappiensis TaxID=354630 RepID=A0A841JK11_9SPHI|nr:ParA family protein [Mucilaginibacter lappiensis]MBB6131523.1 chromosome partitioning protein [Mucilaginibacter lappiensis]